MKRVNKERKDFWKVIVIDLRLYVAVTDVILQRYNWSASVDDCDNRLPIMIQLLLLLTHPPIISGMASPAWLGLIIGRVTKTVLCNKYTTVLAITAVAYADSFEACWCEWCLPEKLISSTLQSYSCFFTKIHGNVFLYLKFAFPLTWLSGDPWCHRHGDYTVRRRHCLGAFPDIIAFISVTIDDSCVHWDMTNDSFSSKAEIHCTAMHVKFIRSKWQYTIRFTSNKIR